MSRLIAAALAAAIAATPAAGQIRLSPPMVRNVLGQPFNVPPQMGITYEDAQVLAGNGYSVSSAVVAVPSGSYLTVELSNPAGSGVNYIMTARVFSSNVIGGQAPLEYSRYASASVFPTGTATGVTINNRLSGAVGSTGTFRYIVGTTPPAGAVTSSGFVPTNGEEKRIKDIVVIAPGGKLVYTVGGAGGGLAAMARMAVTFLFWTTPTG